MHVGFPEPANPAARGWRQLRGHLTPGTQCGAAALRCRALGSRSGSSMANPILRHCPAGQACPRHSQRENSGHDLKRGRGKGRGKGAEETCRNYLPQRQLVSATVGRRRRTAEFKRTAPSSFIALADRQGHVRGTFSRRKGGKRHGREPLLWVQPVPGQESRGNAFRWLSREEKVFLPLKREVPVNSPRLSSEPRSQEPAMRVLGAAKGVTGELAGPASSARWARGDFILSQHPALMPAPS